MCSGALDGAILSKIAPNGGNWIVEKDKTGASELYSLSDVTGILKGAPYEKWYLSGRLGGIPGIQSLDFELNYAGYEAN